MGLETGNYITDLVQTNPAGADPKSQGDDQLRLIKKVLVQSLSNIYGPMLASHLELNAMVGIASNVQGQLTALSSSIGARAPIASPTFTGTVTVPTPPLVSSQQAANMEAVFNVAYAGLPLPILQAERLTTDTQAISGVSAYKSEFMTGGGNFYVLPDARNLTIGFAYEVYAPFSGITLMQHDGVYIGSTNIPVGLSRLWLLDNTTEGGTWAISPGVAMTGFSPALLMGLTTTISTSMVAANTQTRNVKLDDTRTLLFYATPGGASATSGLYAVIVSCPYNKLGRPNLSLSAAVRISGGPNIGVGGATSNQAGHVFSACLIGPDQVAVSWQEYSSGSITPRCAVVSTTGAAPAPGAPLSLRGAYVGAISGGSDTQSTCVCSPSAGTFVVAYQDYSGTGTVFSRCCTATGNVITSGAEVTIRVLAGSAGALGGNVFCVAHNSGLVSYAVNLTPGGSQKTSIVAATISGTTLAPGAGAQFTPGSGNAIDIATLGASAGLVIERASGYAFSYTILGNAVALGAGYATGATPYSIGVVSAGKAFIFTQSTSTAYHVTVSGTTVAAGSPATITGLTSTIFNSNALIGNAVLNGGAVLSGMDIIDAATATWRGQAGTYPFPYGQVALTGNGRYTMNFSFLGSPTLNMYAFLPSVPLN